MANRYDDREQYDDRRWRREGRDDRGFLDRAGDEVRSWFGDEEAERRRRMDEQREGYSGGRYSGGFGRYENRYARDWDEERQRRDREYRDREHRGGEGYRRESFAHPEDYSRAYNENWRNRGQGWSGSGYTGWGGSSWPSTEYGGYARGAYGREREYGRESWYGENRGRYAGRGPSGYRRSDERIREDINDRLTDDPYIDASNIEVFVKDCEVTLRGHVDDRESKRRAEDLAEWVSGVRDVRNELKVGAHEPNQPRVNV